MLFRAIRGDPNLIVYFSSLVTDTRHLSQGKLLNIFTIILLIYCIKGIGTSLMSFCCSFLRENVSGFNGDVFFTVVAAVDTEYEVEITSKTIQFELFSFNQLILI